jgi:phosphatidylserine decarboxylase
MRDRLFIIMQYLLPQHLLSRLAGAVADCHWPWLKNAFINWFVDRYQVDMSEAIEEDPTAFSCFNDFSLAP